MKYFRLLAVVCLFSSGAWAQTLLPGALLPALPQQFLNANGAPAANGRLCTQASGTSTALAVYSDPGLTMPLPNPIKLNAAGIATTNGTTETAVYTSAASYRVTLYGPSNNGIGTCNGQPVGALIWQFDGIYDFGQLNGGTSGGGGGGSAHPCTTGADMAAKITAAYSTLPSSGGIIDCSNLITPQSLGTDPFTGMTVPTTVIFPVVTSTSTVALKVPPNVTLLFPQGAILTNSNTTNIAGRVDAGNWQIFSGTGQVCFGISPVCNVTTGFTKSAVPQWWGALGNAVILGGAQGAGTTGCSITSGFNLVTCPSANFSSADIGKSFDLAHAGASNCGQQYWGVTGSTFNCNLVGTISTVPSSTTVTLSLNASNTVSNEQFMYAIQESGFVKSAINSGVSQIVLNGSFGITSKIQVVMNNQSMLGGGTSGGRMMIIYPIAYGTNKDSSFVLDNGSNNDRFENIQWLGSNELGELNSTAGASPDGFLICSGAPGGLSSLCNSNSGINNIRFTNCSFDHTWGIGLHAPGTGTISGQQVIGTFVLNSVASWNSLDGFNLNPYDNEVLTSDSSRNNGTGGMESSTNGSISVVGGQYSFNRLLGISLGGFTTLQHSTTCEVNGADLSENGNGFTTNTTGIGLSINDGTQNCSITGNTIHHNHVIGVAFSPTSLSTMQNLVLANNVISSNGLVGGSITGVGITCGCVNVEINNNQILDESTDSIVTASLASNVITVQTLYPHNLVVGNSVTIVGTTGAIYDGTYTVATVPAGNKFTVPKTAANSGPNLGGFTTTPSLGFIQSLGIDVNAASANTQIVNNQVQHNRTANVQFENTTFTNVLFQSTNNFPNAANNDLNILSGAPSLTTLTVRIPDIQTTGNVCTTGAGAGSTCTTVITHNLQFTPNNTKCSLDNTPNAQSGTPLLIKVDTSTSATTATVTIGNFTAVASGGGTMRCNTNFAY